MRKVREGVDYEIRRDNAAPTDRSRWVVFIRGNGHFEKVCGRFHDILKLDQTIQFTFEPTYIPGTTTRNELDTSPEFKELLSSILYDILDRSRNEGSLIFTSADTGQNLNKAVK